MSVPPSLAPAPEQPQGPNAQLAADRALVQTLILNAALAIVSLLLFSVLRTRLKYLYTPLSCRYPNVVPAPKEKWYGWITAAISYDDVKLLKTHGLDHVVYSKYLSGMLKAMVIMSIFGFAVLIPIDGTGKNKDLPEDNTNRTSGTSIVSMANIMRSDPQDQWRFLGHVFSLVFNTIVVCTILYFIYRQYFLLKIVSKSRSRAENYTVLIQGVAKKTSLEEVFNYFSDIFPDQIIAVHRVGDLSKARFTALKQRYWKRQAKDANAELQATAHRPTTRPVPSWLHSVCRVFICVPEVDAIDYYTDKEAAGSRTLKDELESPIPTDVMFITFKSILTARACGQILLTHNIDDVWRARPAPLVSDVNWDNCRISRTMLLFRRLIVFLATLILIVFWSIPTAFAVSLANISTLTSIPAFKWLVWISSYPILKGFVEGILPILVILIFFQLVLYLLRLLTGFEGHISRSGEDKSALGKFYGFMMINIFLISILAGSVIGIWNQIEQITQNTGYLLNLLAVKIPPQVNFFINYIATTSVLRHLMNLLRPIDLAIYFWRTRTLNPHSHHEKRILRSPPQLDFADVMATDLLVFAITITYSSISALILVFGLLYFAFAKVGMGYNLIYVYRQRHQGLGKLWATLFACTMSSLIIYQATILGMFIVNVFSTGVVLSSICLIGTVIFWIFVQKKFSRVSKYAPLDRVQPVVLFHEGDPEDQLILNSEGPIDLETAYVDPVLKQVPAKPSRRRSVAQSPDTDRNDSDLDDGDKETDEEAEMMREHEPDDVIA